MSDLNRPSALTKRSVEDSDSVELELEITDNNVVMEQDGLDFNQGDDNAHSVMEFVPKVEPEENRAKQADLQYLKSISPNMESVKMEEELCTEEQDALDLIQNDNNFVSFEEFIPKAENEVKEEIIDDSCVNSFSTIEVKSADDSSDGVSTLKRALDAQYYFAKFF